MADQYDYVVIGSGAAGSVVAARLAESGRHRVCVIEAGGDDRRPFVTIPAGFVKNLNNPKIMWQFGSVAGENTGGRSVYLPQGKLVGGSTSINGMIYNRGQAGDFDHWASLGNPGWSYQEVLPFFRKSETRLATDSQYRGSLGPLSISDPDQSHPLCDAFIDAVAESTGAPKHNDYNAESQRGTGYYQRFISKGRRQTTAREFLQPAIRQGKVDLRVNTPVTRLLTEGTRVTGVEVKRNGREAEVISATREVILCAGTINSSRLLQCSGIGDEQWLKQVGVDVVHHLPGVGQNLQDHYFVRLAARLSSGNVTLNQQARGVRLLREIYRWATNKPSILSWTPSIAYAFLNSSGDASEPDLQFVFSHGSYRPGKVYELDRFPAVTCGFTQQRPRSRGYTRILSANPGDTPEVQPNYLVDDYDCEVAVRGIRMARGFLQSPQFAPWFENEEVPGSALDSYDELLDYARQTGNTGYHLVGSCTMGPGTNPMAVVDPALKVHGMQSLRVVDASVMPTVTSSNTCAASIMIGEKGADLILQAS
jgi:choline dehydrogenase